MGAASGDSAVARGAGGAQVAGAPAGATGGPPTRAGERRAASTISRTPINVRTAPAAITPHASPPSEGTVAPTRACTDTPCEPSAFMTISIQLPSAGAQVN